METRPNVDTERQPNGSLTPLISAWTYGPL